MGYTDIHCHLMPGVDDGSRNLSMTGRMLEIASEEGISRIIITPHYKPDRPCASPDKIHRFADSLNEISVRRGWNMSFFAGNELMYHSDCTALIAGNRVCTLADTDYVLMEFEPGDDFGRISKGIRELIYAGYIPVLAHIERYRSITEEPERAYELEETGCLFQINASSVFGDEGRPAKALAYKLLREKMVSFVATDAHTDGRRSPRMKECAGFLEKNFGPDYTSLILEHNAAKLIAGEDIWKPDRTGII